MKRYIALLACVFALAACGNQSDADNAAAQPDSDSSGASSTSTDTGSASGDFDDNDQKRSYALGMDIGNSLKELPVELDIDALSEGVRDTVGDGDTRLSQKELDSVMQGFVQDMEEAQKQKVEKQADANAEKGKKFLAENKDKEGVKTTDSGLQYKVIEEGSGPEPSKDESVTVHYVGKLIDGTVFDSSRKRGEPVTFPVDAVIPGWTEALQLMKVGANYKLFIPADLAYGERGAGAQIGPNETLIFDVELLDIGEGEDSGQDQGEADSQADSDSQGGDTAASEQDSDSSSEKADESESDNGSDTDSDNS